MPIDPTALQQRLAEAFRGELEVTGLLGVGGFAAVLERDVAIKVATVEHPHIVPLYGAELGALASALGAAAAGHAKPQ